MAIDAERAKTLFLAASDLANPAERAAFLDRECGGDAELLARVEALLRANAAAPLPAAPEATIDPADGQPETADYGDPTARVGAILAGKYKLVEEIGEGGMGSVFMAQQTEPVRRAVAVKVIKAGMDSRAVLARFEAERQALAMMDHPNIAKVLDAGTTDGGRPFFVMELVKGTPITRYCDEHKLTPRQRLELFVPVCQAIQHAHQKGIIHRDIKPSNVLVALYDDRPVPKVIDFGVAKAAGQALTDKTLMTGLGAVVGTPEYMSPEQASLNNLDIDTRSDVYSLGVLLYELLTGTTPVDKKSLGKAALLEILRIVREVEAPRPSAKLSTMDALPGVAANRGTEPAKLSRLLKGELDWLVLKALEKDRTRRYETANGLARDVQRYLADEVVEARPPSAGYRLKKFVRRHKGQVMAVSLVLLALVGGMVGTTLGLFEAWRQEQIARDETGKKEKALVAEAERVKERDAALDDALKQKKAADDAKDDALKQKKAAEQAAEERRRQLANSQVMLADAAWRDGNVWIAKDRLDEVPADLRRWEWRYLKQTSSGSLFTLYGHAGTVSSVAFSPDGARLASGSGDKTVKVWDARTGQELLTLKGHKGEVTSVAFSPDGTRLASGSGNPNNRDSAGEVKVWDARTGRELLTVKEQTGGVTSVAFSPDGARLASASYQTVKVWDARTGQELHTLKGHTQAVRSVAFSPDGARLASGSGDFPHRGKPGEVKVWDARTGQELRTLRGHTDVVWSVGFSPDGTRLASGSIDGTVMLFDARICRELYTLKGHTGPVFSVAFSPEGVHLASASYDGTVKVWDARTGQEIHTLKGHTNQVNSVAFSPDGARLASGSHDQTVKVWDARTGQELHTLKGHTNWVNSVAFSPDGARLASASYDRTVKVWDAPTGQELQILKGHTGWASSVAFSPEGALLASGGHDQMVKVWDARTGQELHTLKGHINQVNSVAFSPDGVRLVSASADWTVKVWDARTGQELHTLKGHTNNVRSVTFSPDGARLGSGSQDGTVKVWDARSGQELHTLKGHNNWVTSVAFSPDGQRVVSRDVKGETVVWDFTNGQRLNEPVPQGLVWGSARSPDGRLFAWIDRDTIRLIGPPDAEELLVRRAQTRLDAAWHRDEAARWEKDKQWQTAAFHLEQALRAQPGDGDLRRRLAAALAQAAESDRTLTNAAILRRLALAQLHTGQVDAYRRTAQQMQERFAVAGEAKQASFLLAGPPGFGLAANRLVLTDSAFDCGLLQWQQTIRAAVLQPGVLQNPQTWLARLPKDDKLLRGAIFCRYGEPIMALAELAEVRDPFGLLFRALAEHGRGNQAAARAALAEAKKRIGPDKMDLIEQTPLPWLEMVETRVLVKELETLLRSK